MVSRFGQVHLRNVNQMEFKQRNQKRYESHPEYKANITLLTQLSHPRAADDILVQLSSYSIFDNKQSILYDVWTQKLDGYLG